jgi:hypothetical protein
VPLCHRHRNRRKKARLCGERIAGPGGNPTPPPFGGPDEAALQIEEKRRAENEFPADGNPGKRTCLTKAAGQQRDGQNRRRDDPEPDGAVGEGPTNTGTQGKVLSRRIVLLKG